MNSVTVEMADYKVVRDRDAELVTYALGSCIAVILHDPVCGAGGMLHYMLPVANERAKEKPAMFAETGIPLLFEAMYRLGCRKQNLVVKAAGGGKLYDDHGVFDIGRRNYVTLRKMLWKSNVIISAEDVGGSRSRTARLYVGTGRVTIHSQGEEAEL